MTGEHEEVHTTVGDREVTVTENSLHPEDLVFVQQQAIMAGLPMHAISDQLSCDFGVVNCATSRKKRTLQDVPKTAAQRLQERLGVMSYEYPDYQGLLERLEIICDVHDASASTIVCLADHEEKRLYVAARGTHRSISRVSVEDWKSNLQIAIGSRPYGRTELALEHYRRVKREHTDYVTFGTGHSLGGAVMIQLATCVEDEPEFRFERVDVFNTAVGPFERNFIWLQQTELHIHRIPGDWASLGLNGQQAPNLHMHPAQTHVSETHSLQHFLPIKASERARIEEARKAALAQQQQRQQGTVNTLLGLLTACMGNRQKDSSKVLQCDGRQPILQQEDDSSPVSMPPTPRQGDSDDASFGNVSEDENTGEPRHHYGEGTSTGPSDTGGGAQSSSASESNRGKLEATTASNEPAAPRRAGQGAAEFAYQDPLGARIESKDLKTEEQEGQSKPITRVVGSQEVGCSSESGSLAAGAAGDAGAALVAPPAAAIEATRALSRAAAPAAASETVAAGVAGGAAAAPTASSDV